MKRVYEISGADFLSLDGFFEEISRKLNPDVEWGRNLDAFNDILRGGFGPPETGFVLRWGDSDFSRERLGYPETARQLRHQLRTCHRLNRQKVLEQLKLAESQSGDTVFDWLVDIILAHRDDGVELELC
ncbi:MAG: barstar family protein [Candidatus Binataceae bacterium]